MHCNHKLIHFFYAEENFLQQDTILNLNTKSDTISKSSNSLINLQPVKTIDLEAIDSILRKSEEREQQIIQQKKVEYKPVYRRTYDTTELFYKQFGIAGFPIKENLSNDKFNENIFLNFSELKPKEKKVDKVFDYVEETETSYQAVKEVSKPIASTAFNKEIQFDWITILFIANILLLGWVRLFNRKYIVSIFKSIFSYNESYTLLREKNSLMERASFILNTIFVSILSLFSIQLIKFFNVQIEDYQEHVIYLFVFAGLLCLYILRYLSAKFIGYLFLQQKPFTEYLHNINIYTKVTGLILLPITVIMQYLTFEFMLFVAWIGIILIGLLYLFQVLRAFQILIRNYVSIFYMILYLCAFEITPFLIAFKLLFM